jgi:hypothetical protein
MDWRGNPQEFSNVYHYTSIGLDPGNLEGIKNTLVAAEKAIHATAITFIRARAWGPTTEGPAGNNTQGIWDLTGAGTATTDFARYRETAYLIYWKLGRYGSLNRMQYARKWLHTLSTNGVTPTPNDGTQLISAVPAALATYMTTVTNPALDYNLCTADGRVVQGPPTLYPWLEHRQLGR